GNIGIILIVIYIISFLKKEENNRRNVMKIIIVLVFLIMVFTKMSTQLSSITNKVDKYQLWIYTQFGKNSYRKALLVTSLKDVWKLPLGIILYLMSPIIGFYNTRRFMLDIGGFLKFFEQVIILLGILGLPKLFVKSKWIFAAMMIPLIFVASTNNSNYRQGIFISPIVYLSASLFYNYYLKDTQYKSVIIWIMLLSCIFMNSILLFIKT
ncbi:MAG: hypothetical protein K0R09_1967, partial [Clostridiales bacterium]|nr:hypothetical protein [Clostridiales bacterium]